MTPKPPRPQVHVYNTKQVSLKQRLTRWAKAVKRGIIWGTTAPLPVPYPRLARVLTWTVSLVGLVTILSQVVTAQVVTPSAERVYPAFLGFVRALQQPKPDIVPTLPASAVPAISTPPAEVQATDKQPKFGHLPYPQATQSELMVIGSYSDLQMFQRYEYLSQEAGLALMRLSDAARLDGVWIVPVSGFRDYNHQASLFQWQIQQTGSPEAAAKAVAPPGHSEHHTGYAIDLADGISLATDVSLNFEETKAFAWLTEHAKDFGFELSFPKNNAQGVEFEPWHWRYIKSSAAARLFAQAEHLYGGGDL